MRNLFVGAVTLLVPHAVQAQLAAPNDEGVRFAHVHFNVADVGLHTRLWTELFDGVLVERAGYSAVRLPGAILFFTQQEPTEPSVGTVVNHVGFKVRDLDGVLARWRALGYEVDSEFTGGEGFPQAYIIMPNGAKIELTGDPELSTASEMHHVHFYSAEYRDLLAWYIELLGATPRTRGTIETTADVPGSNLSFGNSDEAVAPTQGTAVDHIGFEVEDMNAFAEKLEGMGVEFQIDPFYVESLDVWVGFFLDPSGARVEITQGLDKF